MSREKERGIDFVVVRTMTPREVVSLLLGRFPAVRDLVCTDEYCFEEPTRVYDAFAQEVIRRARDREFTTSVVQFIDELAESKDPLIGTVLVISLLEGIAADPGVAKEISAAIGEPAKALLQDVERKIYGR